MAGEPKVGPHIGVNSRYMTITAFCSLSIHARSCSCCPVPLARSHCGSSTPSLTRDARALWIAVHPERVPR